MSRSVAMLLVLSLAGTVAGAREAGDDTRVVLPEERMERLNASLERIAEALELLRFDQQVLLTLRRVELAERRIAPLENRLEQARGDVRSNQDEVAQLESITRQLEDDIQDAVRAGADPTAIPQRGELDQIRAMTELARERLAEAERRVIDAEDRIAEGRRRIEILDEMVEALLQEGGR